MSFNYINSYSVTGRRPSNEDQHYSILNNTGTRKKELLPINLVCVFDGHGGKAVSKYLKDHLPDLILKKTKSMSIFSDKKSIIGYYFSKLFDTIQNNLKNNHPIIASRCGSTALCGLQYYDKNGQSRLIIANVGDSRAVLCNGKYEAVPLSVDHKPNLPSERKRIEKLGGKIKFDGVDWRIKDLSLSRAVGDLDTYPYVTHRPEVFRYRLSKKDKFIIFACDGLWDVFSNQKAVNFVNKLIKSKYTGNIAKKLCEEAIKLGTYDNVTAVILFL